MIKLIIFDLDGVLIDSKDIHFEALNRALVDYNEDPIPYKEHISKFDGKPTREKLSLKGIDEQKRLLINERKQTYTIKLLEEYASINQKLIDLFGRLKNGGFVIHVASNSVNLTLDTVINNTGLAPFIDFSISNEEVTQTKPHPEMYLRCMIEAGIGPRETLIVEDSYVGRQAAFNSGAYLCGVSCPDEVSYDLITSTINRVNGIKPKWHGNDINIVIPMAGAGSRFVQAGYTFPKPLIEIMGKPMIQVVVENLNIEGQYIFIVRKEHCDKYNIKSMLEILVPGCRVIIIDELTEGAACTVLLAKEFINNNSQLIIANSDQYVEWDSSHCMYSFQNPHVDGGILTFFNTHPKWSYARLDENGLIQEVKEKDVISNDATVGIYHWRKGSDYVKYAEDMIRKNIRVNNEFYVCPVYNEALADGKKFKAYKVDQMYGLGTPEDLNYFLSLRKISNG